MSRIEDELRRADQVGKFFGRPATIEGLVLEHGRRFEPAPLPDDILPGEPKQCFSNAMGALLAAPDEAEYRYCEGYMMRPGNPLLIHHAWVTVDGEDVAYDPTIRDNGETEYWGIDFQSEYAVRVMEETGVTGRTIEQFVRDALKEQEHAEAAAAGADDRG